MSSDCAVVMGDRLGALGLPFNLGSDCLIVIGANWKSHAVQWQCLAHYQYAAMQARRA